MTEENYNYRTSQLMLRNAMKGDGEWKIPIIPKFEIQNGDFDNLLLIGFDKTNLEDTKHLNRMVHFFLYDYKFERIWKQPDNDIEKLLRYRAVLSPDFSMYLEMNRTIQLYNVFRNRWCGAYWVSKGIRVIPTVNWGDENTFDFCFRGIKKGSVVAVSTYMAIEHDNRSDQKEWFMKGYNEMLSQIEPEKIICYNTPFPEMAGDIVFVDYELSSWRYMNYERNNKKENLECYKIDGVNHGDYDIIQSYRIGMGGGSAYGGKWKPKPNKPNDSIFFGPPNTIKRYFISTNKGGYWIKVKYDSSGRAVMIRHETGHSPGSGHSDPHDHTVEWVGIDEHPEPSSPINYPDGESPDFKSSKKGGNNLIIPYDADVLRFNTISEFKTSMRYGAEVVIEWKNREFGIWSENGLIRITASDRSEPERIYKTSDDALEHVICGDRLRDIITQMTVIDRSI